MRDFGVGGLVERRMRQLLHSFDGLDRTQCQERFRVVFACGAVLLRAGRVGVECVGHAFVAHLSGDANNGSKVPVDVAQPVGFLQFHHRAFLRFAFHGSHVNEERPPIQCPILVAKNSKRVGIVLVDWACGVGVFKPFAYAIERFGELHFVQLSRCDLEVVQQRPHGVLESSHVGDDDGAGGVVASNHFLGTHVVGQFACRVDGVGASHRSRDLVVHIFACKGRCGAYLRVAVIDQVESFDGDAIYV